MKQINNNPERNQEFELDLNFITINESLMNRADFETYAEYAFLFLRNSKMVMTEEDIEKRYNTKDINNVISSSPFFRETVPSKKQDGTPTKRYVDIAESYFVKPEDSSYDMFFAYKLRQIELLEIDDFLEYHLYFYYSSDMIIYKRFLLLCLRSHKKLFTPETELTVAEWIETKEKQINQLEDGQLGKVRSKRPVRTNNDNKTSLTGEQTVLLAHYLQEKNVFYNGYLTDAEIATAFEILTGYSHNKLRTNLPKAESFKTHENVKALDNLISNLAKLIAKDLPETKK
jgi:hypothetical protein